MKAIEIEAMLKEKFIGKKYDSYHGKIGSAVLDYLAENGFDRSKLSYNRGSYSYNTLYIEVITPWGAGANVSFITIDTKKKKVADHRYYCDWEYKDFLVTIGTNATVEEACTAAAEIIGQRVNAVKADEDKAVELFEILKTKGYSQYEAVRLVKFMADHRYTLSDTAYGVK